MTAATVIPLHAAAPSGRRPGQTTTSAIPFWLDDDAIVRRAVDAKRTHPPSPNFWRQLAELARTAANAIQTRAPDGWPLCALRLLDNLAVELARPSVTPAASSQVQERSPTTTSRPARDGAARADAATLLAARLDEECGQPSPTAAPGERAHPHASHRYNPGHDDIARLADHVATLAAVLVDPRPPRVRDLAILLDDVAVALWAVRRTQSHRPARPVVPVRDRGSAYAGRDPP